jgi:hydroxymethylglutaryl-CoA lyase
MMLLPLSASHAHSLAQPAQGAGRGGWPRSVASAPSATPAGRTAIEVGISTAFGCTIQGRVEPEEVVRLVQAVLDAGVDAVSLADTVGYADPAMVSRLFERVLRVAGDRGAAAISTTRAGLALANVFAALQLGIARFDACTPASAAARTRPAPAATSPPRTSLHAASMGVETGLDLDRCLALRAQVVAWLRGERPTARSGRPACRRR